VDDILLYATARDIEFVTSKMIEEDQKILEQDVIKLEERAAAIFAVKTTYMLMENIKNI